MVWRGDPELPLTEQGLTMLGAPVGQVEFVQAQLTKKGAEHEVLLEMIPQVPNVQVAWLLILFSAGARANFLLRTVQPELTQEFARHHDEQLARCLRRVLHINTMSPEVQVAASMPLSLGGLGIGNSERTRDAAHWGSWADCLEMIKIRHPDVARRIVQGMATRSSCCFQAVEEAASRLRLMGVDTPNWEVLSSGLRPEEGRRVKHRERDPTQPRHGWQKVASAKVHEQHREEVVWPLLSSSQRASVRSQSGPLASVPFTSFPTCRVTRMESKPFRVLLLRRLRMPLSVRSCVCGRRLDLFGHQPGSMQQGRGSQQARICCRERCGTDLPGARVSTNVMIRDVDIAGSNTDVRRLEVVPRDCPFSEVCSWHWMRRWCPPIMGMGHL